MAFNVKNTMFCSPLEVICPHSCRGCGELGTVLCSCCKNDIILEHQNFCPNCRRLIEGRKCTHCHLPPTFMVGWRDEIVGKMAQDYKYHAVRANGKILAEMLDSVLPCIDGPVILVPLPTVQKHIRQRGVDHTWSIAKFLAKRRGWKAEKILLRTNKSVQVGASQSQRLVQAHKAYSCPSKLQSNITYILLDDVWTTGASMRAAAKELRAAGAQKIMMAILAVNRVREK